MTPTSNLRYDRVSVILRIGPPSGRAGAPETGVGVLKALWSVAEPGAEVARLNQCTQEQETTYVWKAARLERRRAQASMARLGRTKAAWHAQRAPRAGRETMRNYSETTVRNRGKNVRTLTIREIKMAICSHERLAPAGPSEQRTAGGSWHTKLACPTCGAWTIRETADAATPMVLADVAG